MILRYLCDYYHKCLDLYPTEVPPLGFEKTTLDYVLVIEQDGTFTDNILTGVDCIASRPPSNKTGTEAPTNILWDSAKYMLNINDDKQEEPCKYCNMVIKMLDELVIKYPHRQDFIALQKFYQKREYKKIENHEYCKGLKSSKSISFIVKGEKHPICQYSDELKGYVHTLSESEKNPKMTCLIDGEERNICLTFGGVSLGKATNGKIVSFQKDSGYDSQGKIQGENAPISVYAEYAYIAALKRLISSEKNSVKVYVKKKGKLEIDRILVFWSSAQTKDDIELIEHSVTMFTGQKQDNDPDDISKVKAFFSEVKKEGINGSYGKEKYYFLELVPTSKGRIAISFWNECSLVHFADIILRHFEAMKLDTDAGIRYDALSMVNAVSLYKVKDGKPVYDRIPNLIDSVFRCIYSGTDYPEVLFRMAINRTMAEQNDPSRKRDAERAAIFKAYLYRNLKNDKLKNMLNKEITDKGYLCGRLFAALERTQERANYETTKEWKSDLRSKYMNAAMTTPATVFPAILANSNYHLDKISYTKEIEELKQEIIGKFDAPWSFPPTLSVIEQGSFFIGYYQQKQTFYTKDKDKNNNNNKD